MSRRLKPNGTNEDAIFVRQLRYTDIHDIYDNLTDNQKLELELMLSENSDNVLGINDGGILQIDP